MTIAAHAPCSGVTGKVRLEAQLVRLIHDRLAPHPLLIAPLFKPRQRCRQRPLELGAQGRITTGEDSRGRPQHAVLQAHVNAARTL